MREAFLTDKQEVADYYKTHRRDTSNLTTCLAQLLRDAGSRDLRVLVVGCGSGLHDVFPLVRCVGSSATYSGNIVIDAVDRSTEMLALLKTSIARRITRPVRERVLVTPRLADIERGFSLEGQYDLVLAISVLQHNTNWREVLNTLIPAVNKGGHVIIDEWFSDSPFAPLDCATTADPQFRLFSVLREKHTGIFWDPEVRAHDMLAVRNYFKASGFTEDVWDQPLAAKRPPSTGAFDLKENVIGARGFGPLAWGGGRAYDAFVRKSQATLPPLILAMRPIGFRVYCFGKTRDQEPVHATSTPVFEGRIANHFCLKLPLTPASGMDAEMLRHVQALQAGLHYSCFSSRTRFAFSIIAKHDSKTGELDLAGTRPTRAVLVPGSRWNDTAVDTLTRLLANILVLAHVTEYGSVTADLLKVFEDRPDLSHFSFRLAVAGTKPEVQRRLIDGVDLLDCTLPCRESPAVYAELRDRVRKELVGHLLEESIWYSFGEFRIVDLEAIKKAILADADIQQLAHRSADAVKDAVIEPLSADVRQDSIGKDVLPVFARLIPMMNPDEELLLVFSPVQYRLDEEHGDKAVRAMSLGALAILEERSPEAPSMLAFRIARMEFLDLALQWTLFGELYGVVSPWAPALAILHQLRQDLLKKLRVLDSVEFFCEKRWKDIVSTCVNELRWPVRIKRKARLTDTLSHLLAYPPSDPRSKAAGGLCSQLSRHIGETIKVVLLDEEDARHVEELDKTLLPRILGGVRWWPLLHRLGNPFKDFWPKYFASVLEMSGPVKVDHMPSKEPFFIPFLAFPLGALNFGKAQRPTPPAAEILLIADKGRCSISVAWAASGVCETRSVQELLDDRFGRGVDRVAGRLKFLKRLFGEVGGRGFWCERGTNNFSFYIGYGNG
jgi:SAM-dependent methyltransferase